jgi:hypothetical protein
MEGYGLYAPHYCPPRSWGAGVQTELDKAADIADLARIWGPLERRGEVDSAHGSEWHHAVAHMAFLQERTAAGRG